MIAPAPSCRVCGKDIGGYTNIGEQPNSPKDGDYSVCLYCGTWSVFEHGGLRAPTCAETLELVTDPQFARAERLRRAVMKERP
jgi:hypothetical protein